MDAFWSKVRNVNIRGMKLHKVAKEDMDTALYYILARSKPGVVKAFASELQKILDNIEKSWSVPARGLTEGDSRQWDSIPQPENQVAEQRKKAKRRPEQHETISLPQLENLEIKGEKAPPRKAIKKQNYTILNGMFNSSPD
jgi:hypothetical protein